MGSIFYAPFVQHENAEPARVSIWPSKARVKCSVYIIVTCGHTIRFVFASGKTMNSLDLSKKKRQKEVKLWPIAFLLHVDLHDMCVTGTK